MWGEVVEDDDEDDDNFSVEDESGEGFTSIILLGTVVGSLIGEGYFVLFCK